MDRATAACGENGCHADPALDQSPGISGVITRNIWYEYQKDLVMTEREIGDRSRLFGSPRRTSVLVLLGLLEESYPSELAVLLDARLFAVQTILDSLESDGIIVTRRLGNTRRVQLNPRFVGYQELRALLWKLGEHDVEIQKAAARKRGRPRRKGKPG
jgi:DNA-binding transcriptional ArsR family regulator